MLGVVLCGGQSSRMGMDKGMLYQTDKSFAQIAWDKLEALDLEVVVSINNSQQGEYSPVFPASSLIKDDESITVKGPLLGIMSCHLRYPTEDLFILACDLPLMDINLLRALLNRYLQFPGASTYLFTNNDEPEPLCGIYTSQALSSVWEMIKNGKLLKYSMKFLLQQLVVERIELSEGQKKFFKNFNNPADLSLDDL